MSAQHVSSWWIVPQLKRLKSLFWLRHSILKINFAIGRNVMKGAVLFVADHRVKEGGVLLPEVILETSFNERGHVFVIIININVFFSGILGYACLICCLLVSDALVEHLNDLLGRLIDKVLGALCVHSAFLADRLPLVLFQDLSSFRQRLVHFMCFRLICDHVCLLRQKADLLSAMSNLAAGSLLVGLVMHGVLQRCSLRLCVTSSKAICNRTRLIVKK